MPSRNIASNPFSKDLLTSHEVADRFSIAHRTLWKMVARGQFPQPIRFNSRLVRWKTKDLQAYLDNMPTKKTSVF